MNICSQNYWIIILSKLCSFLSADDNMSYQHNNEQRENLGVVGIPEVRSASIAPPPDPTNAFQKVQVCFIALHSQASM